jgi:hypothetical protein
VSVLFVSQFATIPANFGKFFQPNRHLVLRRFAFPVSGGTGSDRLQQADFVGAELLLHHHPGAAGEFFAAHRFLLPTWVGWSGNRY